MKALSLTQPWASLVASGAKRIETRSWGTAYRGAVAIHAAKAFPRDARDLCVEEPFATALRAAGYGGLARLTPQKALPLGQVVAVCILRDVTTTEHALVRYVVEGTPEESFGDYSRGRYAWILSDIVPLAEPVPARGALGLWRLPDDVERRVRGIR